MEQEKPIANVSERKEAFFDYGKQRFYKGLKLAFFQMG